MLRALYWAAANIRPTWTTSSSSTMVDRTHGDFAIIQTGLAIGEEVGREDAARALSNLAFNADNHSRWPSPRRRARWRRPWCGAGAQWERGGQGERGGHAKESVQDHRDQELPPPFGLPRERSGVSNTHDMPPRATRHTVTEDKAAILGAGPGLVYFSCGISV